MILGSVRNAQPIRKLCRGRTRNLLAQRRRNAVKQLTRLPSDLLTQAPHESRPFLGAPQMPPVFPRIAPAAAPAHVGPQPGLLPVRSPVLAVGRRSMNGRVFSSPVAGFSMTHMSGSKCAMISRALSTRASPVEGASSELGCTLCRPGWPRPCQSAPAETACSPSSGCRTGSWAQISTRCPGRRPPTPPPRRLGQSTLCRKTAPAVSACLTITTSTTKHAQARARVKQFRMLGPIFF